MNKDPKTLRSVAMCSISCKDWPPPEGEAGVFEFVDDTGRLADSNLVFLQVAELLAELAKGQRSLELQ